MDDCCKYGDWSLWVQFLSTVILLSSRLESINVAVWLCLLIDPTLLLRCLRQSRLVNESRNPIGSIVHHRNVPYRTVQASQIPVLASACSVLRYSRMLRYAGPLYVAIPVRNSNRLSDAVSKRSVFTARRTLVESAVLRSHVVRPSVCLSVCPSVRLWRWWIRTT